MSDSLFDPAPDFDQPIAVLRHCHERIRKQIKTMQRLLEHLPRFGANLEAQQAAQAVLNYFNKSAQHHHADEEQDLMPMLQQAVQPGEDADLLAQLVPKILKEHQKMDAQWAVLALQLEDIASGESAQLSENDVQTFGELYASHMVKEETYLAPMAMRWLSPQQMQQLGQSMQIRRGILPRDEDALEVDAVPEQGPEHDLAAMRTDYARHSLSEADVDDDPIVQFQRWFEEALQAGVAEPNAMSVATADAEGRPSNRILLIKQYDQQGFTWFTNYASRKGQHLFSNPYAALLFFWHELERQVRIEGRVEQVSAEESDAYFNSRPLGSRLAALASDQSEQVLDRASMEQRYAAVEQAYGDNPQRPVNWGGYRLRPTRIEFWQGRPSRFHDRIEYQLLEDGSWHKRRLQP